ncbi:hypothetical protein [Chryseobacterium hispalense]|uniref:hypothetical protein n=1 Tax=Chryseobacterium hispalense TaxID=1453492 RepID=UPI0012F9A837|nr:hypothetical protein [Chryseobacterium hispalense]
MKTKNLNLRKRLPKATAQGSKVSGTPESVPPKRAGCRNSPNVFRQKDNMVGEFRNETAQRNGSSEASETTTPEGASFLLQVSDLNNKRRNT